MRGSNKYLFWEWVCSGRYAACTAHAPYYIAICGLSGSTVFFSHQLINGTICGKTLSQMKRVFWFSLPICSDIFLVVSEILLYKYIGLRVKCPFFSSDFNETCILLADFRKIFKFHENPSIGSRFVPRRRAGKQTDMMKLHSLFAVLRTRLKT